MKVSVEELKKLIIDICQIEESKIVDSANLKEDLQMDSLNIADLMASLEEDFEIEIIQEDAMKIKTFSDLVSYIEKH